MRKLFYLLIVLVLLSCNKVTHEPIRELEIHDVINTKDKLLGEWVVSEAIRFTNDESSGNVYREDLFNNSNTANLRFNGALFEMDSLVRGVTTWWFSEYDAGDGYDIMYLNGNSIYGYDVSVNGYGDALVQIFNDPNESTPKFYGMRMLVLEINEGVMVVEIFRENLDWDNQTYHHLTFLKK